MPVIDEEPMETVHIYLVLEEQLPPKNDIPSLITIAVCALVLVTYGVLSLLVPPAQHDVSFAGTIHGFALRPVRTTSSVTTRATGKGSVHATTATGTITFYNGALYVQIIPVGTILTSSDGASVVTDEQAVIPPAAQTTPPTYGQVSVLAHALRAGASGNIAAGDLNEACCVTSVIAQNPFVFTGGTTARSFTYLTAQDVTNASTPLLAHLQTQTLVLFPTHIVLEPQCMSVITSNPVVGKETTSATVSIHETCHAFSYSKHAVIIALTTYEKSLGAGTLAHTHYSVVASNQENIILYVTGQWNPMVVRHWWSGK